MEGGTQKAVTEPTSSSWENGSLTIGYSSSSPKHSGGCVLQKIFPPMVHEISSISLDVDHQNTESPPSTSQHVFKSKSALKRL